MTTPGLRPYQLTLIAQLRQVITQHQSVLCVSPTGSGKTRLTVHMLGEAAKRGVRGLFICPRRELIYQAAAAFDEARVGVGLIMAGTTTAYDNRVQIASVQTLPRRDLPPAGLVVWDEAAHMAAGTWVRLKARLTGAKHIGLTATPQRLDGRGLGEFFSHMVMGPSVSELIRQGWLSDYVAYAPPGGISVAGLRTEMGDYSRTELAAAADRPTITGNAIAHYKRICPDVQAVAFAVNIAHSQHIAAEFNAAGIPAGHVDGSMSVGERDATTGAFRGGRLRVLCNVDLLGEGYDVPAIGAAILLRPTQSLALYLQQVGRALRPSPSKARAVILDHAGNTLRHGLPDDEREWSLDSKRRCKRSDGAIAGGATKCCPKCFAVQRPAERCRFCNHIWPVLADKPDAVEGDLVKVDKAALVLARAKERKGARTIEELTELGRRWGMKHPVAWAGHVMNGRRRG